MRTGTELRRMIKLLDLMIEACHRTGLDAAVRYQRDREMILWALGEKPNPPNLGPVMDALEEEIARLRGSGLK